MSTGLGSRLAVWLTGLLFYGLWLLITLRPAGMSWHDWQRAGEILLCAAAAVYLLASRAPLPFDRPSRRVLAAVTLGGLLSSALASQPIWGLTEVALMAGCLTLILATGHLRRTNGPGLDAVLVLGTTLICSLKLLQFCTAYLLIIARSDGTIDPWQLMDGFANLRFYGQFITLTLPLLALPMLHARLRQRIRIPAFFLLAAWWMVAIASGTRGTWLAMATAMLLLALTSTTGRRWAKWQLLGALSGLGIFWLLFNIIPGWLNLEISNHPGSRMTTSMSLRDSLWLQAWQMIKADPWLGAGPMHFATTYNGNAVHPHQALLQWMSEWGIPSAIGLSWLLWHATTGIWKKLRNQSAQTTPAGILYLCLAGCLLAGLVQSMVDGIIVMPYSHLWLCLLAGWLLALHTPEVPSPQASSMEQTTWRAGGALAATLLLMVMARDMPQLNEQQTEFSQTYGGHLMPRFWTQGLIAQGKPEIRRQYPNGAP